MQFYDAVQILERYTHAEERFDENTNVHYCIGVINGITVGFECSNGTAVRFSASYFRSNHLPENTPFTSLVPKITSFASLNEAINFAVNYSNPQTTLIRRQNPHRSHPSRDNISDSWLIAHVCGAICQQVESTLSQRKQLNTLLAIADRLGLTKAKQTIQYLLQNHE